MRAQRTMGSCSLMAVLWPTSCRGPCVGGDPVSLPAPRVGLQGLRISLVRVHLNGQCSRLSHLDQTVSASVEVRVTVTSQNYSEKLQDRNSVEFSNFNKTFTKQVTLRELHPPQGPFSSPPHLHAHPQSLGGVRRVKMAGYARCILFSASQVLRASQVRAGKQGLPGSCKRVAAQTWSLDKRTFYLVSVSLAGGVRIGEC